VKRLVARAPNHLGDGVMALPALHALAGLGRLEIAAPSWGHALYRDVNATVRPRGPLPAADAAVLFAPSLRAAWEGRRAKRRIGTATDGRRFLLTDIVAEGGHRADTYRALVEVLGARVVGAPRFRVRADDPPSDVPRDHLALNPVSVSGEVREWLGFRELALQSNRPVVFYAGPGEAERVRWMARGFRTQVGLGLPALASAISRAAVFVSNDSGPAHFARAVGTPTVVVFGSTTPTGTGAAGAVAVEGQAPCRPCYRQTCGSDLRCLAIPVSRVSAAVLATAP
jgi:heptosyltransferase II